MCIRLYNKDTDRQAILNIWQEHNQNKSPCHLEREIDKQLAYVGVDNQCAVMGFLIIAPKEATYLPNYIYEICVKKEKCGEHVWGRALLNHVKRRRTNLYAHVDCESRAVHFYEENGFRKHSNNGQTFITRTNKYLMEWQPRANAQ